MGDAGSAGSSAGLRQAIESKRAKIGRPGKTIKTLEKEALARKKWWNERISIQCIDEEGISPQGCSWNVPRARLTSEYLEELCRRCSLRVKPDYLRDENTKEIVWLDAVQKETKTSPWNYTVVPKEETPTVDIGLDPHYRGDAHLMLLNAPLRTENGDQVATADDIREWIRFALKEEDHEIKTAQNIIADLKKESDRLDHKLSRVGYANLNKITPGGVSLSEDVQENMRNEMYDAVTVEKDAVAADLKQVTELLASLEAAHANQQIDLEKTNERPGLNKCSYLVTFAEDEAEELEAVLVKKSDWKGIKLAAAHDVMPTWAGRGMVPDGSKAYLPNYKDYAINMRGVLVCRLQHGFGEYKELRAPPVKATVPSDDISQMGKRSSSASTASKGTLGSGSHDSHHSYGSESLGSKSRATTAAGDAVSAAAESAAPSVASAFEGEAFGFYHGQWSEGEHHGIGIHFLEGGTYFGSFEHGKRYGQGQMRTPCGDHLTGTFASETRFPDPHPELNPYAIGQPHGDMKITFADGATYAGNLVNGRICGQGIYQGPHGECLKGNFENGVLHGQGSFMDTAGQVRDGHWVDGYMHGEGRISSGTQGTYEGDWFQGDKEGKGKLILPGGNTYHGFFLGGDRAGPGVLYRGNTKEVVDPRTAKTIIRSNRVYEGLWRGSSLRPGSMVTITKTGDSHCIGISQTSKWGRPIERIRKRERLRSDEVARVTDFHYHFGVAFHRLVEKAKQRVSKRQLNTAIDIIKADAEEEMDLDDLQRLYHERDIRVDQLMRVTDLHVDDPTLLGKAAEEMDDLAEAMGMCSNRTVLSSAVLSTFEEVEEQQQLIMLDKMSLRAEEEAAERVKYLPPGAGSATAPVA
ncbi:unnamed protein product [Chrysoparadoxa australica]